MDDAVAGQGRRRRGAASRRVGVGAAAAARQQLYQQRRTRITVTEAHHQPVPRLPSVCMLFREQAAALHSPCLMSAPSSRQAPRFSPFRRPTPAFHSPLEVCHPSLILHSIKLHSALDPSLRPICLNVLSFQFATVPSFIRCKVAHPRTRAPQHLGCLAKQSAAAALRQRSASFPSLACISG